MVFLKLDEKEYDKAFACIHCGFCLPACPTYRINGNENDSPRGRIHLIKNASERISVTKEVYEHIDLCVLCRACEPACPSGVKFADIMEAARDELKKTYPIPPSQRLLDWIVFSMTFPHPRFISLGMTLLRYYQKIGLQNVVSKTKAIEKLGRMAELNDMIPTVPRKFFRIPKGELIVSRNGHSHRVAFFTGCVMSTLLSPLDEATVRVLLASGCELVTPKNQVCCGALHVHNGEINIAKKLARKNIDAFSRFDFEAVVVNSAGCGALLKNYSELLSDDQKYAKKAVEFSAKVKDVSEFLTSLDLRNNLSREIKAKVTYQEPCHLANVQKVRNQPRSLIQSIPGIEYVEMKNADRCCGAGGNYFLKHHDESMKMLDEKMANVKETGADIVVTSNPPCYIQLLYGVKKTGQKVKVMHLVELLDQALTRQ